MVNGRTDIPERQYAVGVAFLRGLGAGKVKAIHGLDEAQKRALARLLSKPTCRKWGWGVVKATKAKAG